MHIDFVKLSKDKPTIGKMTQTKNTTFGEWVEIGSSNLIDNSSVGD
ncbi:MAG: chloramphenicol acetyltransferase, partial [Lentilactobacillus parabuchneri]|nr:chloramphenicol acetyltransferase [Lentilactobacillus parabuchneri]